MIRINLLPVREVEKGVKSRKIILIAVAAILIEALALGAWYKFFRLDEIQVKDKRISEYTKKISDLQALAEELKKYKAEAEDLDRRLRVIYTLQRAQMGPVRVLDELSKSIPGQLWLTSLKEKEGKMEIKGIAIDNPTIANFMTRLEKSGVIRNVELVVSQQLERKDIVLKEFTLTCQVFYGAASSGPTS
jgi:type IV pilus assembly protein PilN